MKDTRPAGYPGTLKQWESQCRQQGKSDQEVLAALARRLAHLRDLLEKRASLYDNYQRKLRHQMWAEDRDQPHSEVLKAQDACQAARRTWESSDSAVRQWMDDPANDARLLDHMRRTVPP